MTYPNPKGMGHYGHVKTGNFRKTLSTFDAIHTRPGIVAWLNIYSLIEIKISFSVSLYLIFTREIF